MKHILLINILCVYLLGVNFSVYCVENELREDVVDCAEPSFDCAKVISRAEEFSRVESFMCDEFYNYNKFSDIFFTSYYNLIMKNISKSERLKVKAIAKEAMRKRDDISHTIHEIDLYIENLEKQAESDDEEEAEEADQTLRVYARKLSDPYDGITYQIELAYMQGVLELTWYLLKNNPELFTKIFKYTEKYKSIFYTEKEFINRLENKNDGIVASAELFMSLLENLYKDNLIDKTGKLIVKIDK
ncbi:hypothetical protein CQA53_09755 [Helicobacter didelphidarum]|uniref:Uncharacterized protein n=1 Tax=Helicobacter didelphidarum TaxID=2040648 RepID=A0A3D8I9N7_9HELI|nr:hypothetical protein [Helicobacter didelphidarum]RDU61828.1 hypothetical protein CQA53_09755 [Helicobacter didelphidarum]